jgi:hypothetical protein
VLHIVTGQVLGGVYDSQSLTEVATAMVCVFAQCAVVACLRSVLLLSSVYASDHISGYPVNQMSRSRFSRVFQRVARRVVLTPVCRVLGHFVQTPFPTSSRPQASQQPWGQQPSSQQP